MCRSVESKVYRNERIKQNITDCNVFVFLLYPCESLVLTRLRKLGLCRSKNDRFVNLIKTLLFLCAYIFYFLCTCVCMWPRVSSTYLRSAFNVLVLDDRQTPSSITRSKVVGFPEKVRISAFVHPLPLAVPHSGHISRVPRAGMK